jgi:hypothetical protein
VKRFFVGVLAGLVIGWITLPSATAGRIRSYMDGIEKAVELLEKIEKNTRKE